MSQGETGVPVRPQPVTLHHSGRSRSSSSASILGWILSKSSPSTRTAQPSSILATTKNFETKTIDHIVNVAASLPLLTHLVINESRLCTTMCKSRIKSCCVFEPIETRSISTHWGNSGLDFTVYRRRTRWTENPYGHVPRGEETARAFAERALCNEKRIHR